MLEATRERRGRCGGEALHSALGGTGNSWRRREIGSGMEGQEQTRRAEGARVCLVVPAKKRNQRSAHRELGGNPGQCLSSPGVLTRSRWEEMEKARWTLVAKHVMGMQCRESRQEAQGQEQCQSEHCRSSSCPWPLLTSGGAQVPNRSDGCIHKNPRISPPAGIKRVCLELPSCHRRHGKWTDSDSKRRFSRPSSRQNLPRA